MNIQYEPEEEGRIICAACGSPCDTVYMQDGRMIGCDNCVRAYDAIDMLDERLEEDWGYV